MESSDYLAYKVVEQSSLKKNLLRSKIFMTFTTVMPSLFLKQHKKNDETEDSTMKIKLVYIQMKLGNCKIETLQSESTK